MMQGVKKIVNSYDDYDDGVKGEDGDMTLMILVTMVMVPMMMMPTMQGVVMEWIQSARRN